MEATNRTAVNASKEAPKPKPSRLEARQLAISHDERSRILKEGDG